MYKKKEKYYEVNKSIYTTGYTSTINIIVTIHNSYKLIAYIYHVARAWVFVERYVMVRNGRGCMSSAK